MNTSKNMLTTYCPYIVAVIITLLLYRGIPMLGSSIGPIVGELFNIDNRKAMLLSIIIITIIILLLYRLCLSKKGFKGVMSITGKGVMRVLTITIVAFVIDVVCIIAISIFNYGGIGNMVPPSMTTLLISLCAAVYEESAFRAIPISILMKNKPTDKKIILSLIITSFIFGAVHMSNVGSGELFKIALYQSFQAMVIGMLFSALYLRSGSIVLSMAYHFLHNMVGLMLPIQSTGVMLQQTISPVTLIFDIIIMSCEIAVTVYLLRPSIFKEIGQTWQNKWSEEETERY